MDPFLLIAIPALVCAVLAILCIIHLAALKTDFDKHYPEYVDQFMEDTGLSGRASDAAHDRVNHYYLVRRIHAVAYYIVLALFICVVFASVYSYPDWTVWLGVVWLAMAAFTGNRLVQALRDAQRAPEPPLRIVDDTPTIYPS